MKEPDLPWGLVGPLGRPRDFDPTELPHAKTVSSYSVEENDLHFTVYFESGYGKRRLYVAELADAVHVVAAVEPALKPGYATGTGEAWVDSADGMLHSPLGARPVIDATRGLAVPQEAVRRYPHFDVTTDIWASNAAAADEPDEDEVWRPTRRVDRIWQALRRKD